MEMSLVLLRIQIRLMFLKHENVAEKLCYEFSVCLGECVYVWAGGTWCSVTPQKTFCFHFFIFEQIYL